MNSRQPKPNDGLHEHWQIRAFEEAAKKCDIPTTYDPKEDVYEDHYLQAAWDVFINIDVNTRGYF